MLHSHAPTLLHPMDLWNNSMSSTRENVIPQVDQHVSPHVEEEEEIIMTETETPCMIATWVGIRYGDLNQDCGAIVRRKDGYAMIVCDGHQYPVTTHGWGGEAAAQATTIFLRDVIQSAESIDSIDLVQLFEQAHEFVIEECVNKYPDGVEYCSVTVPTIDGYRVLSIPATTTKGKCNLKAIDFGTTCTVVLVSYTTNKATLAYVGDSDVYSFIPQTLPIQRTQHLHTVQNRRESERLQRISHATRGAANVKGSKWIYPRLPNQSGIAIVPVRSIGHAVGAHWGVTWYPDIISWSIQPNEVIIAATDGFWPDVPPDICNEWIQNATTFDPAQFIALAGSYFSDAAHQNQDNALVIVSRPFVPRLPSSANSHRNALTLPPKSQSPPKSNQIDPYDSDDDEMYDAF